MLDIERILDVVKPLRVPILIVPFGIWLNFYNHLGKAVSYMYF